MTGAFPPCMSAFGTKRTMRVGVVKSANDAKRTFDHRRYGARRLSRSSLGVAPYIVDDLANGIDDELRRIGIDVVTAVRLCDEFGVE